MTFLDFKQSLKALPIFSFKEIQKIFPLFDRKRITEWKDKGYITQIAKGFYYFPETEVSEEFLFYASNKIYEPSYISLETALSYYNLIPEGSFSQTAVSTRNTTTFISPLGNFSYKMIKPSIYFGYTLQKFNGGIYKIAEAEKCLLDFLYFNPKFKNPNKILGLRFDFNHFKEIADMSKLRKYLVLYNNKELEKRYNRLEKVLGSI